MPTADQILAAVSGHQYALAVSLILVASVAFVRKVAPSIHSKVGAWLNSDRGGATLVLVGGTAGAVATALIAGKHMSLSVFIGALMTSASASGLYNLWYNIKSPADKAAPPKLSDTVKPPETPVAPVTAWLPFILIPALLIAACGFCQQAANKDTARCKAEKVVTDCAAPEAIKIVKSIIGEVAAAIASNDYVILLAKIQGDLTAMGRSDGWGLITCAINAAQSSSFKLSTQQAPEMKSNGDKWKVSHPCKTTGSSL
jgi:hypothetical protein